MSEYLLRFLIGGTAVSLFAVLGDVLRPKSFAGLFGAAPSIALPTLAMALAAQGPAYASREGRTMMAGALALFLYSLLVCQLLTRARWRAMPATIVALLLWFAVAMIGRALLGE